MMRKIDKLIVYLSILKETIKYKEQEDIATRYNDVDIIIDDDFKIKEKWCDQEDKEDFYHIIEFSIEDIDGRIKSARDHLRYLKKRSGGVPYGS